MKDMRIILLGTASLVPIGCADGALGPIAPEAARWNHAAVAGPTEVSGTYAAVVDFATLTLAPRGENCLLVVDGKLVFSGMIEGTAVGTTTALVFGPCSEVGVTPPGTFRDVFTSELHFVGTVDGDPAEADVLYQGSVQVGGAVEARLLLSNGVAGVLDVDAFVAAGGSYEGAVVVQ